VVVNDFDFVRIAIPPLKANSPRVVDGNVHWPSRSHTAFPADFQVARQFLDAVHILNLPKLPKSNPLNCCKSAAVKPLGNAFCFLISKRAESIA
jgi:hypothetical protein